MPIRLCFNTRHGGKTVSSGINAIGMVMLARDACDTSKELWVVLVLVLLGRGTAQGRVAKAVFVLYRRRKRSGYVSGCRIGSDNSTRRPLFFGYA